MTDRHVNIESVATTESAVHTTDLDSAQVMSVFGFLGSPLGLIPIMLYMFGSLIEQWFESNSYDQTYVEFTPIFGLLLLLPYAYIIGLIPSLLTGWMYWRTAKGKQAHLDYISSATLGLILGGTSTLLVTIIVATIFTQDPLGFDLTTLILPGIGAFSGCLCGLIVTRMHRSKN